MNRWRNHRQRRGCSVKDEDLEELRTCFELGFNFDSPNLDLKLSSTLPSLEIYQAMNRQYGGRLFRSKTFSDSDTTSFFVGSLRSIVDPGDDLAPVKTRLKEWAQVVAYSMRRSSRSLM